MYLRRTGKHERLFEHILRGTGDASVPFTDLLSLLRRLGFDERTRGSHHVFRMPGVEERTSLQADGRDAKPYQIRQVRTVFLRYRLGLNE